MVISNAEYYLQCRVKVKDERTNDFERICLIDSLICGCIERLSSYCYGNVPDSFTLGDAVDEMNYISVVIKQSNTLKAMEFTIQKKKRIKLYHHLQCLANDVDFWSKERNSCCHGMAKQKFTFNQDNNNFITIKSRMKYAKRCSMNGYHLWTLIEDITCFMIENSMFRNIIIDNIPRQHITKAYSFKYNYPYKPPITTNTAAVTTNNPSSHCINHNSSHPNTYRNALTSSTNNPQQLSNTNQNALSSSTNPSSQPKINHDNNTSTSLTYWSIGLRYSLFPLCILFSFSCYTLYNKLYTISKSSYIHLVNHISSVSN